MLLSAEDLVCRHCGGPTEFRAHGDLVAIADDDQMVNYKAFCVTDCVDFQQSGEAVAGPSGSYATWESRY